LCTEHHSLPVSCSWLLKLEYPILKNRVAF